jgi:hypothetical protein
MLETIRWKWINKRGLSHGIRLGVLITPIALSLAVSTANAGPEDYDFARMFFPYTMVLARITVILSLLMVVVAFVQYPIYGAVIGGCWNRPWLALLLVCCLVAAHLGAVWLSNNIVRHPKERFCSVNKCDPCDFGEARRHERGDRDGPRRLDPTYETSGIWISTPMVSFSQPRVESALRLDPG